MGGEAVLHVDSLEPYMIGTVRRPLHPREARFSQLPPAAKAAFFERAAALLRGLRRVECLGRGITDVVLLALARAAGPQGLTSVAVEVRPALGLGLRAWKLAAQMHGVRRKQGLGMGVRIVVLRHWCARLDIGLETRGFQT